MKIIYKNSMFINKQKLLNLYEDAKWSSYTSDMPKLLRAFKNSDVVVSA